MNPGLFFDMVQIHKNRLPHKDVDSDVDEN